MKQLILMRHAKAMKESADGSDFDRDLEEKGKKDAADMAQALFKTIFHPEKIIASPARRTSKTAHIVAKEFKLNAEQLEFDNLIYAAGITDLVSVIHQLDDRYHTVMLVGHNPAITAMVGCLTPTFAEQIPTSGMVVVEFEENNWKLIQNRSGQVMWFMNPKNQALS